MNQMLWEFIGLSAACLTMFGFVPQLVKIYKTHSVEDVSLYGLIQLCLGQFAWLVYSLHIKDVFMIVANTVSFSSLVVVILLYLKYRKA
jgi:MtN3 and saliva related transmembrane protein